jgi:ATP-dependent Lhr-like helicase
MWARLTPPKSSPEKMRASGPVRTTPIALLERKNLATWDPFVVRPASDDVVLSPVAEPVYDYLIKHGASFFSDVAEGTGLLTSQAEDALGELVACGRDSR